MSIGTRRKNEGLLLWLRAAAMAGVTFGGLYSMGFEPAWGAVLLALAAGVASLGSADLGVIVAIVSLAIPIAAANAVVGIAFLVLGVVGVRYLGADGGRGFLLISAAVAGAFFGPVWAAVAIAGYLMSAGPAALAAAVACLTVEVVGVALGSGTRLAATIGSGTKPMLDFASPPQSLFSTEWIGASFGAIDARMVDSVLSSLTNIRYPLIFAVQPLVWAAGAAVTATLVREARRRSSPALLYTGVAVGVLVPAVGSGLLYSVAGMQTDWGAIGVATVTSAAVGLAFTVLFETVFAFVPPAARQPAAAQPSSMAAEDADVDELLRLVATAEEKLATQHTTTKVVMITDMKSFSRMTEEDGSIVTAKAIQQHRDLLLPVIEANGGHGKSTGGDGLVAAFERPAEALSAAVAMQRALHSHNEAHPGGREMSVRIGVADGEVVLDKGGRPFIGAALNLAARVMNLADGGQAFTTAEVARLAGKGFSVHSHGAYQLKNIAAPVEVVEVLWSDGQAAREPQHGRPAQPPADT